MPPDPATLASQIEILVSGYAVSDDVMSYLERAEVDQQTLLPAMASLTFWDPDFTLVDGSLFRLANGLEVRGYNESGVATTIFKGEITALEPAFTEGGLATLTVQAFDKSHRLFRESRSESYLNIKDSDLASQIAGRVGLSPVIESTSVVYDHLFQHNQTDMEFLMQRAWRIGYLCFVADESLYFKKAANFNLGQAAAVSWQEDLIAFRVRESAAEQVDEVLVKGWDAETLQPIVGQASNGNLLPTSSAAGDRSQAASFGTGQAVLVDLPVVNQTEANQVAQARLDELSGAFLVAEGEAYRRPDLSAGYKVTVNGVGNRFSGDYVITSARHVFTAESGLRTTFSVRGTRTGLLAEQFLHRPPQERRPGVVFGIVTNTDDPNDWGRVKVQFPWMSAEHESWWARVAAPGAGPGSGLIMIPEVGDEVVVAFEHGDFNRPVVIGSLWNGNHAIPAPTSGSAQGERPQVRVWYSETGHQIAVYDNADNKIEIQTAGGHSVLLDDANRKVELKSSGGHTVTMDDQGRKLEVKSTSGNTVKLEDSSNKVTVQSNGMLDIIATGNLKIQGGMIDIQGSGIVTIKGSLVNIN